MPSVNMHSTGNVIDMQADQFVSEHAQCDPAQLILPAAMLTPETVIHLLNLQSRGLLRYTYTHGDSVTGKAEYIICDL